MLWVVGGANRVGATNIIVMLGRGAFPPSLGVGSAWSWKKCSYPTASSSERKRGASSSETGQKRPLPLLFSSEGLPEAPHPLSSFCISFISLNAWTCMSLHRQMAGSLPLSQSSLSKPYSSTAYLWAALAWRVIWYLLVLTRWNVNSLISSHLCELAPSVWNPRSSQRQTSNPTLKPY